VTRETLAQSFKQALVIVFFGIALALVANASSQEGIILSHDFFSVAGVTGSEGSGNPETGSEGSDSGLEVGIDDPAVDPEPFDGIQRATIEDAEVYFEGSLEDSSMVFVDARRRSDYEEGHIPGAIWLYHYQSERLFDEVREDLEQAFIIVVYCNGGDCEDSINLASDLSSLYGLPPENIFVYEGGLSEWQEAGLPVQVGGER